MSGFVPKESIDLLRRVLATVVTPNRSTLLSFGILGTLWTASGGFAAAIEALDIAYEVEEARPFWVTRPLAVALTLLVGVLLLIALAVMILGRNLERGWLYGRISRGSWRGLAVYPLDGGGGVHRAGCGIFILSGAEREAALLGHAPGAVLVVGCWIGLSYALGFYFRSFANFNKTYGTMAR